jgi:ATP-dependent exoDNAse (exonuclease V) beta subunit
MTSTILPLSVKNVHPRDADIIFDPIPHIYTVCGEKGYTSVTTWVHQHFEHFDADKIIDKMMKGGKMEDPTYKYYGMTREQIKEKWDVNRDNASGFGTKMHADIEDYYNDLPVDNSSIEFEYFKNFVKDFPELKAYRTEWMVYWEEYKISGSIDMIFENPDGTILIYDWKRCKEISYENYNKYLKTPCVNHLPDTNFWHYSLQLNMYKTILETKYNKKVVGLFLVCLHPDNPYKNYDRIEVPFLEKEMRELLELRKFELENNINI